MREYDEVYDICPYCGYVEGTAAKEAYHMEPGSILHGKYIIGKVLGYGGFGVTYIGWDFVLEQVVAVKEYLPSEFATRVPGEDAVTVYSGEKTQQFSIGRDKFSDEAKRLAQFNTVDGVVEIKDTFKENNTSYIVMEYLEGETLKQRIERDGKINVDDTIAIIKSILITLDKVHKGDIIHRDIAPDNIFLCHDGRIKLLDFGASRYATVQHSKSLSVILKEGYAPEEQYRSKGEQGPWSDVYAVGATMYKMLTGVTPEDAMERAENDRLKSVGKYGVKLPKGVETALMNSLNVFAEDRTRSAKEFLDELEAEDVKRKTITRKKIDLGKWPLWSKVLVGCIAVTLAVSGVLLSNQKTFALEDGQAYVPEVINMEDDKATKTVEDYDLTMKIIGQENSNKVDEAKVMTQYPDAGRIVNIGELVEVKISAGNTVVMIDVTGKETSEAETLLKVLGFTKIKIKEELSAAPAGTVIKQSVKAGEEVSVDKRLILTISKGMGEIDPTKDVKVPKFTGMQYDKALDKAVKSKLYLVKKAVKASDKPAGTILSQDKKSGSVVKQGTTVNVTVSSGNKDVEVPYVMYMTESEAKQILASFGLKYSVSEKKSDTVSAGLIMEQSIDAGKKVSSGTKIKLVVSKGRDNVSVPNVSGMNVENAASKLVDMNLRYSISYSHSESVGWGKVISYSPSGKQEKGTKVVLNVSTGTAGKLVTASEYNSRYSDTSRFSADKRYRYATRQKEYTTDGHSSLSGWSNYDTKTGTTTSDWVFSKPVTGTTYYTGYKVTKSIADSRYYYYAYAAANPNNTSDWLYYASRSRSAVVSHMKKYFPNKPSAWDESRLRYFWTASKTKSNYLTGITANVVGNSNVGIGSIGRDATDYVDLKLGLYYYAPVYKVKTVTTTYYYWRWGEWSTWSDWTTKKETSDSIKEDSTVMYYVVGKTPN